jgi:DNA-binding MurR/RpiR family transcriptional regulator
MTVSQLVRDHLGRLPNAELKVARALLANYPAGGLNTVASLAHDAEVSAPTVLRLTERLGFDGYAQFQDALRAELHERQRAPIDRYPDHASSDDAVTRARVVFRRNIEDTLDGLNAADVARAAALIASPRHRIYATGGRFTAVLAKNLVQQLEVLRPGTYYLAPEDRTSLLTDLGARDVLFIIDLRRYQPSTVTFGEHAAAGGAKLIVLTDRWLSPLAASADVVLTCSLDAPHPLDSMVPALAVIETILAGVVDQLGDAPIARMKRYDAAWETAGFGNDYGDRLAESEEGT